MTRRRERRGKVEKENRGSEIRELSLEGGEKGKE